MASQNWFVYASPYMEEFASRFGKVLKIERVVFSNGQPNIFVDGINDIANVVGGANILFFHYYKTMEEKIFEQMILFVLADTYNVKNLVVVDPYDPSATMERVTEEGRIATANYDAHVWSTLPTLFSGRKTVRIIYDHHTLQNRFYYKGSTQLVLRSYVPLFKQHLEEKCGWNTKGEYAVAFPDAGACKRFGHCFPGYHLITCAKQRIGEERVVVIEDGDPKDKHVIMVDDLVRSGGTLIECAKKLNSSGAKSISVGVTHGEFPANSWQKFLPGKQTFDFAAFYLTDSCPDTAKLVKDEKPFVVCSIEGDVRDILKAYD